MPGMRSPEQMRAIFANMGNRKGGSLRKSSNSAMKQGSSSRPKGFKYSANTLVRSKRMTSALSGAVLGAATGLIGGGPIGAVAGVGVGGIIGAGLGFARTSTKAKRKKVVGAVYDAYRRGVAYEAKLKKGRMTQAQRNQMAKR